MKDPKRDFTFRVQHTGAMAISQQGERIVNICQRLFFMKPGTDIYNTNMGLDIQGRAMRPYADGERDTEYENEIIRQFIDYTDIVVGSINVTFRNSMLVVVMSGRLDGMEFRLQLSSDPNTLATQILPKVISGM